MNTKIADGLNVITVVKRKNGKVTTASINAGCLASAEFLLRLKSLKTVRSPLPTGGGARVNMRVNRYTNRNLYRYTNMKSVYLYRCL